MNKFEFKLPDIGEGVAEGEIVKWLVDEGQMVQADQPLVEVMTDKATVTITAPKTGKVAELRAKGGAVVPVHAVLVVFDLGGGAAASGAPKSAPPVVAAAKSGEGLAAAAAAEPAATAVGDIREDLPGMSLMRAPAASPTAARANGNGNGASG